MWIGDGAFYGCEGLASVTIPNSITKISRNLFCYCTGLISVTIPDSVTDIEQAAFYGCTGLTTLTLGNSLTNIGESAFRNCYTLAGITIPNSVTSIKEGAFERCWSMTFVEIPDSVTDIGNHAFDNCEKLTSVTIPGSVNRIGNRAFASCTSLQSLSFQDGIKVIGMSAFSACERLTTVAFPDSLRTIGKDAFAGCTELLSITLPDNLTSIGENAFYNTAWYNNNAFAISNNWIIGSVQEPVYLGDYCYCYNGSISHIVLKEGTKGICDKAFADNKSLTNITIPDSVKWIGNDVFFNCTSLVDITFSEGLTSIGACAFSGCTGIVDITLPDCVTSLDGSAFSNCTGLVHISLPDSLASMGKYVFSRCTSLVEITIPNKITVIEEEAFSYCTSLVNVTIGDSVLTIGKNAFAGCTSLEGLFLPDGITTIANYAFSDCTNLVSIILPGNLTSIESYVFFRCISLMNVMIPDSVTEIEGDAFSGCKSLDRITIPDSIKQIGYGAFNNCENLEDVFYLGTEKQFMQIKNNMPKAEMHYITKDDIQLAYCTGNTQATFYLDGKEYEFPFPFNIATNAYAGKDVKYILDEEEKLTYLVGVYRFTAVFEDFDYQKKSFKADGVYYGVSDHCLQSEALAGFNASLDMRFGEIIYISTYQIEENDKTRNMLFSIAYENSVQGIYRGMEIKNGKKYIKIEADGSLVSYPCMDITDADERYIDSTVICSIVNGRFSSLKPVVQNKLSKNNVLRKYLDDYKKASDQMLSSISDSIGSKIGVDLDDPGSEITVESLSKQMQESDRSKKTAYISLNNCEDEKAIAAAYKALAEVYIDSIRGGSFDFSEIKWKDLEKKTGEISIGIQMVNAIYHSMKGSGIYNRNIDSYTVTIDVTAMATAYFGKITLTKGDDTFSGQVNSSVESTKAVMQDYYEKLGDVFQDEVAYIASSFVYEFCKETGIYHHAKEKIKTTINERYKKIIDTFSDKQAAKFKKIVTSDLKDLLVEVIEGISFTSDLLKKLNSTNTITPATVESIRKDLIELAFDEKDIGKAATKNAKKTLKKEQQRLINALNDYLAGKEVRYESIEDEIGTIDKIKDWFKEVIQCPVDIEVYNENDQLIGYVDSTESRGEYLWCNDSIELYVKGSSKIICFPADKTITIKTIATDNGTMNISLVHMNGSKEIGRLNFYQVSLVKGQDYTQTCKTGKTLAQEMNTIILKGNDTEIKPDEYFAGENVTGISVSTTTTPGGFAVGDGKYKKGDYVYLLAVPDEGYDFIGWYEKDSFVTGKSTYRFTALKDVDLIATFEKSHVHIYEEQITQPFCGNSGMITYTCSCGDSYTEEIPATGEHTYGEWTVTKSATTEAEGEETRECAVCGNKETRPIPKIEPRPATPTDSDRPGPATSTDPDQPTYTLGDVDGDNEITSGDARLALRASVKLEKYEPGSAPFLAADADNNGTIESSDARTILRVSVKLDNFA